MRQERRAVIRIPVPDGSGNGISSPAAAEVLAALLAGTQVYTAIGAMHPGTGTEMCIAVLAPVQVTAEQLEAISELCSRVLAFSPLVCNGFDPLQRGQGDDWKGGDK